MAVKINVAGSKAAPKATTRKPASKRTTTKPASTGSTRTTSSRKKIEPKPAKPARKPTLSNRRSPVAQTDSKTAGRLLEAVKKAGVERKKAEIAHKKTVQALHVAATKALNGGVPMSQVSAVSGISRQWLYKMGDFAGRTNGDTAPAATTTRRKTSTNGKSTASTKRTQSKSTGTKTRPRIKSR